MNPKLITSINEAYKGKELIVLSIKKKSYKASFKCARSIGALPHVWTSPKLAHNNNNNQQQPQQKQRLLNSSGTWKSVNRLELTGWTVEGYFVAKMGIVSNDYGI